MNIVYLLRENIIAGEFKWAVFSSFDEAKQAADDEFSVKLEWLDLAYEKNYDATCARDTTGRYWIFEVPFGEFLKDYAN